MRFLVLGASGMAGHVISIYLKEQGHEVVGYSRRKTNYVESILGDAKDTETLTNIIRQRNFDTIINAIGVLNQLAEADKEGAVFLNSYFPHFLAKITADLDTQIIHMSTDCVFSGKKGPYTEKSNRDGETFYDRSKAMGELEDNKNLTLRNSIVGPDINEKGIGLLNWFMKQEGEVNGFTHAMWTGMTTLQLAKTMEIAAQRKTYGLINMVNEGNISKYKLLKLFNKYLRNDEIKIRPYEGLILDKTLIRTNFEFDCVVPNYETMISEMAEWMRDHRHLYPHYSL
ncbi:SDR family oxidoreductase [Clostridium transplantifaecale]|uniref:SDR family oxidoreductase n=1 Tax=Clostridium transplantifaecale TaxID=2479838 RepID=UPI000F63CE89|nr:sugar nucleotide-binding protein [Clostridium transplantifaecale]